MLLKLDKNTMTELLKKYYEAKGFDGSVELDVIKTIDAASLEVDLKGNVTILGKVVPFEKKLPESAIHDAIRFMLSSDGYKVSTIKFLTGIRNDKVDYGISERIVSVPYCHGAEVQVKDNHKFFQKKEENKMENIKNLEVYKELFIVVDMVNGFTNEGVLHDTTINEIIPRQLELVHEAKNKGVLIIWVKDTHTKDAVEFKRFGNTLHCVEGTTEASLVPELAPFEKEGVVIEKNSTSFFVAPGFEEILKGCTNLKRVEVVGCCTDICVVNGVLPMMNYFDQHNRSVEVVVHEDAIATYGGPNHDRNEYENAAKLLLKQQGAQLVRKNK